MLFLNSGELGALEKGGFGKFGVSRLGIGVVMPGSNLQYGIRLHDPIVT